MVGSYTDGSWAPPKNMSSRTNRSKVAQQTARRSKIIDLFNNLVRDLRHRNGQDQVHRAHLSRQRYTSAVSPTWEGRVPHCSGVMENRINTYRTAESNTKPLATRPLASSTSCGNESHNNLKESDVRCVAHTKHD